MASEWVQTTLGELCIQQDGSIQTGPFGSQLHASDYSEIGTPVVMPINLVAGNISEQAIARVGDEHVAKLSKHKLKPGDIVFSRRGDVTRFALVSDRESGWLCGTGCLKISLGEPAKAIPQFIAGVLSLPETKEWLVQHAVGATMPNLNTGILAAIPVRLPALEIQKQVAGLLDAMKSRIDNLRQTNATLEAIAQALFKSWFVDCDPVRAKAEGREPEGMDAATAALFPSEFEDSELGAIPKGWHVQAIVDAFEINPKRTLSKGALAKYLDMASVPTNGHVPAAPIERVFASGSKFTNGDTLLARITPCLENGKTAHVDFLDEGETAWGSTEFIVLRPRLPLPPYFGYLLARQSAFRNFAIQAMSGTSGRQRVELSQLAQFQMVVPDGAIGRRFGDIVEPLRESISSNAKRAETLAALRDTLLPRLISGKLRLPDAKAEVDALA